MDPSQLEHFRALLQEEFDAVSSEINEHSSAAAGSPEVEAAIVESNENLLEKIGFALSRIEDGAYGACVRCGTAIPLVRLEAKPSVSLCIECQEEKESLQEPRL